MKKAPGTLRRVLRLLRPYRAYVAGSILLAAVFVAASLYVPVLVGNAVTWPIYLKMKRSITA